MRLLRIFALAGLASALGAGALPAQGGITIGTPDGGNCFPFGCALFAGPSTRYQQVWQGSAFGGAVTLSSVGFRLFGETGVVNGGTYTLSLSTTSRGVNEIDDHPFDSNVGADASTIYIGSLAPRFDGTWLVFDGFSFFFDPGLGNLLLDVKIAGVVSGSAFFEASSGTATLFSRAHDFGSGFDGYGLVATFNGDYGAVVPPPPGVIPEPATWAMLIAGFGLVGGTLRRRRGATARPCSLRAAA